MGPWFIVSAKGLLHRPQRSRNLGALSKASHIMVTQPCSTPALLCASDHPREGAFSPGGLSSWISPWTCVLAYQTKPATTAMHKTRKQAMGKQTTQGRLRSSKVQTTHFKLKPFITAWRPGENMHQTEAFYYYSMASGGEHASN